MPIEPQEDEKVCPYCGEIIKKVAIVCRWCKNGLISSESPNFANTDEIKQLTEKEKVLEAEVTNRLNQGWLLISRTKEAAQMTMPKKFNWVLFIVLFIISIFAFGILPFIYLIYWAVKKPEVIVLTVNNQLELVINGRLTPPTPTTPVQPAYVPRTPEEIERGKKSDKKMLLILVCIIVGCILLYCFVGGFALLFQNSYLPTLAKLV